MTSAPVNSQRRGLLSRVLFYAGHPAELLRRVAAMIDGFTPTTDQEMAPDRFFETALFFRDSQLIRPGSLVFDVGANVGSMTSIFLACGGKVLCVEPLPPCVKFLHRRFDANPNVVAVAPVGLSAQPGRLRLSYDPKMTTFATFSEEWRERSLQDRQRLRTCDVEMSTLDALIAIHGRPDYVKIDVEGFELQVLRGLSRGVDNVSFEFTAWFLENARLCVEHLSGLGDYRFNFCYRSQYRMRLPAWSDAAALFQAIDELSRTDAKTWGDIYARRIRE